MPLTNQMISHTAAKLAKDFPPGPGASFKRTGFFFGFVARTLLSKDGS